MAKYPAFDEASTAMQMNRGRPRPSLASRMARCSPSHCAMTILRTRLVSGVRRWYVCAVTGSGVGKFMPVFVASPALPAPDLDYRLAA